MKKLLLFILLLGTTISNAQDHYISELEVTNMQEGINVNLHSFSLNGAGYLSDSYEILGNTILVNVCYWFDNSLPVLQFEDSIMIPLETAAEYIVTVNIVNSSNSEVCDNYSISDSETVVVSFLSTTDFENENENIKLFPNPTNGMITWGNAMKVSHASVYDSTGRLIKEFRNLTTNTILLEGLSDGIYALGLEGENGIYRQKIIVRK